MTRNPADLLSNRLRLAWGELLVATAEPLKIILPDTVMNEVAAANAGETHLFFSCSSLSECRCEDPDDWMSSLNQSFPPDHFQDAKAAYVSWQLADGTFAEPLRGLMIKKKSSSAVHVQAVDDQKWFCAWKR